MNKRAFIKQGVTFGMGSFLYTNPFVNHKLNSNIIKPGKIHFELYKFIKAIKNDGNDIDMEEADVKLFENYIHDDKFQEKFGKYIFNDIEGLKSSKNISISEDQSITFSLFSASIRWAKVDRFGPEYPVYGGFSFNEGIEMVLGPPDLWKTDLEDYLKYEAYKKEDLELISNLIWFEGSTHPNSGLHAPYYCCVFSDGINFPHEFYFYDSGVIYPLPFTGYAEYIRALIANAGVECWQYFYIEPELLVRKNKGLNYMTTDLRAGTKLVEDMHIYQYNESYEFDRLDLIYEYLQRVVKFLPDAFPTFDFDHQFIYMDQLKKLL